MKISGFENIDPGVRALILIVIAVAYPAWDFGFELGAYGRLFYEKVFMAWSISTALAAVILGLVAAGFAIGKNHTHFLTCEDFEISGHYVPAGCSSPAKP